MATSIHRQFAELWNKRDFEGIRALLHPEYSYTGGDGKEMTGGPDVGVHISRMYASAFPDGRLEVQRTYSDGNTAITEFRAYGTHGGDLMGIAPTGRTIELAICNVVELRDGKIYREREYMDMMTLMSQLGVVKLPGMTAGA